MSDIEEEYDFEYSDEDTLANDDSAIDLENAYYEAKEYKHSNPILALQGFQRVTEIQPTKGEWGFKALKQTLKMLFSLGRYEEMVAVYNELLTYTTGYVTPNVAEKAINRILDYISSAHVPELLFTIYEITLNALNQYKNDRLWFKTNLKLAHLVLQTKDFGKLTRIFKDLIRYCEHDPDTVRACTQLLEVYALQIQMYNEQKDIKKLHQVYQRALRVQGGIPHPRTLGIILECGGKMYMHERDWQQASTAFFQSFKSFDEAGEPRRLQSIKYLVLSSMLHQSKIDPFDSLELKAYKNDPEVVAMTDLMQAFRDDRIEDFERILRTQRHAILGDEFIRAYLDDLLRTIRMQVLVKLVTPYTKMYLSEIARGLNNISVGEVEELLCALILDGRLNGRIDQANGVLELKRSHNSQTDSSGDRRYTALVAWSQALEQIQPQLPGRVTGR